MKKTPLFLLPFFLFFISSLKTCSAAVFINEVSPRSDPEWVELYGDQENTSLDGYTLFFDNNLEIQKIELTGTIFGFYRIINTGGLWLNNNGDDLTLKDGENIVDQISYGGGGGLLEVSEENPFLARSPDGGGWILSSVSSEGSANPSPTNTPTPTHTPTPTSVPSPTDTPIPTPTLTNVPTPTPSTAVYKINTPKDAESGDLLSTVKIYVDGQYIHHEDEETLTFCRGCFCDNDQQVSCDFGDHTIRLEKNGYQDWQDSRAINWGDFHEVTPEMTADQSADDPVAIPTSSSTNTPAPTKTPTLTKSKTPTPIKKITPTLTTDQILAKKLNTQTMAEEKGTFKLGSPTPKNDLLAGVLGMETKAEKDGHTSKSSKIIATILVTVGTGLAGSVFILPKLKKDSGKMKKDEKKDV